jgi:hypothetical protein
MSDCPQRVPDHPNRKIGSCRAGILLCLFWATHNPGWRLGKNLHPAARHFNAPDPPFRSQGDVLPAADDEMGKNLDVEPRKRLDSRLSLGWL